MWEELLTKVISRRLYATRPAALTKDNGSWAHALPTAGVSLLTLCFYVFLDVEAWVIWEGGSSVEQFPENSKKAWTWKSGLVSPWAIHGAIHTVSPWAIHTKVKSLLNEAYMGRTLVWMLESWLHVSENASVYHFKVNGWSERSLWSFRLSAWDNFLWTTLWLPFN